MLIMNALTYLRCHLYFLAVLVMPGELESFQKATRALNGGIF
jgi:hypothetical protein